MKAFAVVVAVFALSCLLAEARLNANLPRLRTPPGLSMADDSQLTLSRNAKCQEVEYGMKLNLMLEPWFIYPTSKCTQPI